MVVLRHSVEATDELLRGEVLSILEAMSTRLGLPKFKKHVNVPVGQSLSACKLTVAQADAISSPRL